MNIEKGDDLLVILGDLTASLRSMHERLDVLRNRISSLEEQAHRSGASPVGRPTA